MEETNLAVLIDFENIAAGTEKEGLGRFDVNAIMTRIKDKGRVLVARSYADWGRFSRFKQALLAANVTMMELTSHGMQDKNRADIAMVVDALELAFTRNYVDTYVIVSGDSDFTPMVLKMRELNKRIIGIGTRKSTSRLLIQACDEFIFYDAIVQPANKKSPRRQRPGGKPQSNLGKAFDLLEDTLFGIQRENPDPVHASVVKTAMLRKSPDFNEVDLGFSSFARFLEAAKEAGLVDIERDRKSGGYRVLPFEEDDDSEEEEVLESVGPAQGSGWKDEYLPAHAERVMAVLEQARLPLVSASVRKDILVAIEEIVDERRKKRKKVTVPLVKDDVVKLHLRRTHPELPAPLLRSVFDGLLQAGELIHRDGTAIRSGSASFHLVKDADGLNQSLVQLYLAHLVDAGADVRDTGMLAALFYGDAERRRDVEETVAWLHSAQEGEKAPDLDLDDLLVVDAPPDDEPAPVKVNDDLDLLLVEESAPPPASKPKRPRGRRAEKPEVQEAAEPSIDDLLVADAPAADEKPKRKRTRKKKSDEDSGGDDLDSLLEIG